MQVWIPAWIASLFILYDRLEEYDSLELPGHPNDELRLAIFSLALDLGINKWAMRSYWHIKDGPKSKKEVDQWLSNPATFEEGTIACLGLPPRKKKGKGSTKVHEPVAQRAAPQTAANVGDSTTPPGGYDEEARKILESIRVRMQKAVS